MKIALAQLNYHIGNFKKNTKAITEAIISAKKQKTDLIIFSELSICGYPPHDLLERKDFVKESISYIKIIAQECDTIAAIIGAPSINKNKTGKNLYNSAYFLHNKEIKQIINKTLLPTYDIFDEYRYFEQNKEFNIIEYKGTKIALTICEDLWEKQEINNEFSKEELYNINPMEKLKKLSPDIVVNIAASPFSYTHNSERISTLKNCCKKYNIPIVYVNQIGGNTDLIFDGNSMVLNNNGDIIIKLKEFKEDIQTIDTNEFHHRETIKVDDSNYIAKIHKALILGIKDYFGKMNFHKATLGLSGGIDSAVVVALAAEALGSENIRVLLLPSQYSSDHSINDAVKLAENLKIQYDTVPIKNIFNSVANSLKEIFAETQFNVAEENIQARIRGTLLMGISNKFGHILLNTSNKSEAAVGYGTLYGDMNGGLSVIGDVYKTDVFKLARYINRENEIIPENTIIKPPSAELRPDQKDEDSLPPYEILDEILKLYIEKNLSIKDIIKRGFEENVVKKTVLLTNNSEYKRFQTAPILRISSKSFGSGRKIPLVAKY